MPSLRRQLTRGQDKWAWIPKIQKGDVLRSGNGTLRIVRAVSHGASRSYVYLAIRRCSWTHRCYTVYTSADLKTNGWSHTGKRLKINDEFSKKIEAAINQNAHAPYLLDCCDVVGVVS